MTRKKPVRKTAARSPSLDATPRHLWLASLGAGAVRGFSGFGFSALTVAGISLFMAPAAVVPAAAHPAARMAAPAAPLIEIAVTAAAPAAAARVNTIAQVSWLTPINGGSAMAR